MESSVAVESSEFEQETSFTTPVGKSTSSADLFAEPVTKECAQLSS
jgi:hypothetical protein